MLNDIRMKYILKNNIRICLLIIAVLGTLSSCDNDDDITNDLDIKIFVNTQISPVNNTKCAVINSLVSNKITSSIETCAFLIRATQPVSNDITVTFNVDTSLVRLYNETNETTFKPLLANHYEFINKSVVISGSKMISSDSIKLKLVNLNELKEVGDYMVPICINSVDGANGIISSSNMNVVYLHVNYSVKSIEVSKEPIETAPLDRTDWTIEGVPMYGSVLEGVLNDDVTSGWFSSAGKSITIDMKSEKEIKGISIAPYFGMYASYAEVGQATIELSKDNENWEILGTEETFNDKGSVESPIINYIRMKPANARYIKITCKSVNKGYSGISSVNVYE